MQKYVTDAYDAYKNEKYEEALALFLKSANLYGYKLFEINIKKCKDKIGDQEKLYQKNDKISNINNFSPSISVIVPTYKDNPYINECIKSLLSQKYPKDKIKIIISVNGDGVLYAGKLRDYYKNHDQITVIYTRMKGLAEARNFALNYIDTDYVTYLDDDDWFTPGYLDSLASHSINKPEIICGRVVDYDQQKKIYIKDTYVNRTLDKNKNFDKYEMASLLSTMWCKLYRLDFLKRCEPVDESLDHTEDIAFWIDNIHELSSVEICLNEGDEAYIRRLVPNSMSRPSEEGLFDFYIKDRIKLIERFSAVFFEKEKKEDKKYVLAKIDSQTKIMLNYFNKLDNKENSLKLIKNSNAYFLNKSIFGQKKGVAFCHNFSGYADASSYVATKRLSQVMAIEDNLINWEVFYANMQQRKKDDDFDWFFGRYQYSRKYQINSSTFFNEKSQYEWGVKAFEQARKINANYVYSRSMWAGSHVAALKFKQEKPNVKWIAEFSDPVYMGTDNKERGYAKLYEHEDSHLNDFWRNIELSVFQYADLIIFTNHNQREYMLGAHANLDADYIISKSIILAHPVLPGIFTKTLASNYKCDLNKINIGYFGTFYKNRGQTDLLKLLANDEVVLHVFTPGGQSDLSRDVAEKYKGKIYFNDVLNYFEFLSIASKFDYLYLSDIDFEGAINPYLPSKYADYITTGVDILAGVFPESPLSQEIHPKLIKFNRNSNQIPKIMKCKNR